MNFKMFLEFPGILILVGVILLLISIIISIIAYGSKNKKENLDENNNEGNANALGNIEYETANNDVINTQNKDINENYNFFNTSTQAIYNDGNDNALGVNINNDTQNEQPINLENVNQFSIGKITSNNTINNINSNENNTNNTNDSINNENNINNNTDLDNKDLTSESNNIDSQTNNNEEAVVSDLNNTMIMPTIEEQATKLDLNTGTIEKMNLFTETPVAYPKEEISKEPVNNIASEYKEPEFTIPNIQPVNIVETPQVEEQKQELDIPSFDFDFEEKSPEQEQKSEETIDSILEKTRIETAPIINEQTQNNNIEEEISTVDIPSFEEPKINPEPIETFVEKVPENKRPIYGGTSPLENITLNFQEEKKEAYSNKNYKPNNEIIKSNDTADELELL